MPERAVCSTISVCPSHSFLQFQLSTHLVPTHLHPSAQRQAAIVTPLPGTTRDVLEVSLDIGGMPVIACDTAGIRESDDLVEKISVERASDVYVRFIFLRHTLL